MPRKAPTVDVVIAALLAVLVVVGIAVGGSSGGSGASDAATAGARAAAAKVGPIARRVETIRGLRFKGLPKPLIVTPAQTRADSLRDLDRNYQPGHVQAAAQVLELLGFLKPGTDLRAMEGDLSGQQVAGYYDTHRKRLAIVAGPVAADSTTSEITLAHELDHALDDQRIGLRDAGSTGADDSSGAYTALVEGVATSVMDEYARRYIDPGAALGSVFSALGPSAQASASIPPYLLSSLLFSYVVGERFVNRLRSVAHGWKLVNYALAKRPPLSTEQVIHPEKYLVDERPVPVVARPLRRLLPHGWRRLTRGTFGEFDTDQLLKLGVSDTVAGDAAAGWGGGAYELWGPAGAAGCASPCRKRSALVLTWAWDTPLDAAQFNPALRSYVENGLHGRSSGGPDSWTVSDGAAGVQVSGLGSALALAPSPALAARLASGALGR
jgi:hypothetical protein